MALMELLHTKTPITEADSIRTLACRAMVGLARSEAAKQIISKLPIFTNGQLQQLVREPILQDKRAEHVKFQQYAHELLKIVSSGGRDSNSVAGCNDYSLERLHRASVVAQTKIRFPKKQLLQLIQGYLQSQGLHESASVLQKEANLALMMTPRGRHLVHRSTSNPMGHRNSPMPSTSAGRLLLSPTTSRATGRQHLSSPTPSTSQETPTNPLQIRINRKRTAETASPILNQTPASNSTATPRNLMKTYELKSMNEVPAAATDDEQSNVSLVSIVCDYLSGQHALCKNPMTTCPEFDLFIPHKCPDPRPKNSAPWNFTTRFNRRSINTPHGGPDGLKLDRKLVYGRYRPVKAFRIGKDGPPPDDLTFSSTAFMPDDSFLLAGTYTGDLKMFNLFTGAEESTYTCHESSIYHLQPSRDCQLLLTSSSWRTPYSGLWSLGEFFESKMSFRDEEYVEFSKLTQNKVRIPHISCDVNRLANFLIFTIIGIFWLWNYEKNHFQILEQL